MQEFNRLGFDKNVILFEKQQHGKYSDVTYSPVFLKNCQVIVNHKRNMKTSGTENADIINISFFVDDNPDVEIADGMLNNALIAVSGKKPLGTSLESINGQYSRVYTLTSVNHEAVLMPHYELGGR